jgi:hypothetical protein
MTRRIRVVVTAEDIAEGRRGEVAACPLALALHRRGLPHAEVWDSRWYPTDQICGYPLSAGARAFVEAFDAGHDVGWNAPAIFYLEGPDA